MRALFAKRAKELNNERQEDVQYDYTKEKNVRAPIRQGRHIQSRHDFDQLRLSQVQFQSLDPMAQTMTKFTKAKPFDSIKLDSEQVNNHANDSPGRPSTQSQGRRIFEA